MIFISRKSSVIAMFLIIFSMVFVSLNAVWVTKMPYQVVQPDGEVLDLFVTGDEHHRWLHNDAGFTIVQDRESGYYCWAELVDDSLVSTGHPVHLQGAESLGLSPNINISDERYREMRQRMDIPNRSSTSRAPTMGVINNLLIFIRFSDQSAFPGSFSTFNDDFNSDAPGDLSVYNYFWTSSYQQLEVFTHFYPTPSGNTILSYQDPNPRSYYTMAGAGYNENTLNIRLHDMMKNAVISIASQVPVSLNIDADNDGEVDNVIFLIRGNPAMGNGEVLWPHKFALYYATGGAPFINGKRVMQYNLNLENSGGNFASGVAVYCHEFAHSMGAPDMYRYSYAGIEPVGPWCLMADTAINPQSINAFIKDVYFGWLEAPLITNGIFTVNNLANSGENSAYRIHTYNSDRQYFYVEYRRNINPSINIDRSLPGSGLLVYRVRTGLQDGNMHGPPDELYVYRPNGTLTVNGQIRNAFFSAESGRTEISDETNPSAFLYQDNNHNATMESGLNIHRIGSAGETITFMLDRCDYDVSLENLQCPAFLTVGEPATVSVNLTNEGYLFATNVAVRLMQVGNPTPIATRTQSISAGYTVTVNFDWTPQTVNSHRLYAEAVWNLDEFPSNNTTQTINTLVLQSGATPVYIGNANSSLYNQNLVNYYYKNSVSQTIYYESEFPTLGYIVALMFKFSGTGTVINNNVSLYLGTTTQTLFSSSSNWIPLTDFVQVYNGPIPVTSAGVYDVVVTLQTPYEYTGGNLVLMVHRSDDAIYSTNSTHNTWQYTTSGVTQRTLYARSDTNTLDLTSLPIGQRASSYTNACFVITKELSDGDELDLRPQKSSLIGNYPNPFNPSTTIEFGIRNSEFGKKQAVTIDIYNIKGQKVRSLVDEVYTTGTHSAVWNGTNDDGQTVGSGIYFYKMKTGDIVQTKKMVLMK